MQIEFTFAYSDTWSDGENQLIPYDWRPYIEENNLTGDELATYLEGKIYEFTKDMMLKLIEQGTCPEYVSIGNEMQYDCFTTTIRTITGSTTKVIILPVL